MKFVDNVIAFILVRGSIFGLVFALFAFASCEEEQIPGLSLITSHDKADSAAPSRSRWLTRRMHLGQP